MGSRSRPPARQWQPKPAPPQSPTASTTLPSTQQSQQPPRRIPVDTSSAAYKATARKYTRLMIAVPVLLVTSWVLFDRLALGNQAKSWTPGPAVEEKRRAGE
ncbi:hypothetical protein F4810DRAFT_666860 [Camillea tinctor]|nr:hypothetical protein F4810DRAFT_666860 [Camillea tinctor]